MDLSHKIRQYVNMQALDKELDEIEQYLEGKTKQIKNMNIRNNISCKWDATWFKRTISKKIQLTMRKIHK